MAGGKPVRRAAPAVCPVCGEDVPRNALACPECGADERSGWRENAQAYDGAGLPEEDFDYERFVEEEFGKPVKPHGLSTFWWVAAILVILALGYVLIFRGGFWTV